MGSKVEEGGMFRKGGIKEFFLYFSHFSEICFPCDFHINGTLDGATHMQVHIQSEQSVVLTCSTTK